MTAQRFIRQMHKHLRRCRRNNYTNNFRISCVKVVCSCTVSESHYPKRKHTPLRTQCPLFARVSLRLPPAVRYRWEWRCSQRGPCALRPHLHRVFRNAKITNKAKSLSYYQRYSQTEVCTLVSKFAFWQSAYDSSFRQIIFYTFNNFFQTNFPILHSART